MIKVLNVIPAILKSESNYHYSTFIKTEIDGLKSLGIEPAFFYFTKRRSLPGLFRSVKALKSKIKSEKPDLIHVHYGATSAFIVYLSHSGLPWIITFGGSDVLGHPNKGLKWRLHEQLTIRLSKYCSLKSSKNICVSQNILDALPVKGRDKSVVIPRGVNMTIFKTISEKDARKSLGWDLNKYYVLFSLPRLNAEVKNLILAENVIYKLNSSSAKFKSELIIMTDLPQEKIVTMMNAANALLVTSIHEGSPNIVKEAMACNLPVVSVNCGDVKTRLAKVNNSYVCSYHAEELFDNLLKCLETGTKSNGREKIIAEGIDLENTGIKILNVYQSLIQ